MKIFEEHTKTTSEDDETDELDEKSQSNKAFQVSTIALKKFTDNFKI